MIFRFFVSLNLIYIVTGSKYGNNGECLNQPSSYGYDLNDLNSDCDATQFCSSSNICTLKYNDGVPIYGANPKVVCKNGYSEVKQVGNGIEIVCSSTPVGEMCISGPNPCMTNYCMDPYGFTYPAVLLPETPAEIHQQESLKLVTDALNSKNKAKTNYYRAMNYAKLSSNAYIIYLKYIYYNQKNSGLDDFYNDILDGDEYSFIMDDNFESFKMSKKSCNTFNEKVNEVMTENMSYASTLMTELDSLFNVLETNSNLSDLAYQAYLKYRDIYKGPLNIANQTIVNNYISVPTTLNQCDEIHNYIDALTNKKTFDNEVNSYTLIKASYDGSQTNQIAFNIRNFACRKTCYDKDTHKATIKTKKACPKTVGDICTDNSPFQETKGPTRIAGCSFKEENGRMTVNWNDADDGAHERLGWGYICAETRSPTKYTFSILQCPTMYLIRTREQCLSVAINQIKRPNELIKVDEEFPTSTEYTAGDGKQYKRLSCKHQDLKLFPRKYTPKLNGCGASSWPVSAVHAVNNDLLLPADVNCCNEHDACYWGLKIENNGTFVKLYDTTFDSKVCEDNFRTCIGNIPIGQGSQIATGFPDLVLSISPAFVDTAAFKCVLDENLSIKPNGYSFEERASFMVDETCDGYLEEDYLVTNHWSSNYSAHWTSQDIANSYSSFGPCGKYGTCTAIPNTAISPPLIKVSPFSNETRQYHNNITCRCKRGVGYFCENSLCDGYCKNNGNCTLIGGEPACDCVEGTFGPDCSLLLTSERSNGNFSSSGGFHWWVPNQGAELVSYDTVENDYSDDGADEATVRVKQKQNFGCFGSLSSCTNNPVSASDKSMNVMLTDLSTIVDEETDNIMNWLRILLSMDGGASWDATRQKSVDDASSFFNYFDKKHNNSYMILNQLIANISSEKLDIAHLYSQYNDESDGYMKLLRWNAFVDKVTTFGTRLLIEKFPKNKIGELFVINATSSKIIEYDCDQLGDKSIDGWTCCTGYNNNSFQCEDGTCWVNDNDPARRVGNLLENLTCNNNLEHNPTSGNSLSTCKSPINIVQQCSGSCSNIGDKCSESKTCCKMDNLLSSPCDSPNCWISNEDISNGVQDFSNCKRSYNSSCSNPDDSCNHIGDICIDSNNIQYVCCDHHSESCKHDKCWHNVSQMSYDNIYEKHVISFWANKAFNHAKRWKSRAISIKTSAQVNTQVGELIFPDREEGELLRTLDFSIQALKQNPNVPLLSINELFNTFIEIILPDVDSTVKTAIRVTSTILLLPIAPLIPDIRKLKLGLRVNEKVQSLALTIRPNFIMGAANCGANPESITCLLGSVAEIAFGENEVQKFEQLMQSLKFKFKLTKKKSDIIFKATVSLLLPIVLSDTEDMYLALENENGLGPAIFYQYAKQKIEGAIVVKQSIGGSIPFHIKIGKKTDITVVGGFQYEFIRQQFTLSVRLPFWMMDVLPFTQIPVHIHDIFLKVDFFKSTNVDGKSGVNLQFMGGLCLGTENNCRMKTCDYIQGYYFKAINIKRPEQNMDALLMSELTFGKLLKVMCSSEWFGFCDTLSSKSQFLGSIALAETEAPWFTNTGWSPLTPPCSDPADTVGNGCCTRAEMNDVASSFAKQCYSKIVFAKEYFPFKTSTSTIIIEKGITVSGRFTIFNWGVNIYVKVNKWRSLGFIPGFGGFPRYKMDALLQFDRFTIGGFLDVTRNETSNEGPFIQTEIMTPLTIKLEMQCYVEILPLAIGVGVSGKLSSKGKVTLNASLSLFNLFDAFLSVEFWPNPLGMIEHNGMNGALIRVDITGLNKFVSSAIAIFRAGVADTRKTIIDGITTFENTLISATGVCSSLFPTLGSIPENTGALMKTFLFLGENLYNAITNFIEKSCVVILTSLIKIFLTGIKLFITVILGAVELLLQGMEGLTSGDIISLDVFEASAYLGIGSGKGGLRLKGKIFGSPYDINPSFDFNAALSGDIVSELFSAIKKAIFGRRRLTDTTSKRRRLGNDPDSITKTLDSVLEELGSIGPTIESNLVKMFENIIKFKFETAGEHLSKAIQAPKDALDLLVGGRRRLVSAPVIPTVDIDSTVRSSLSTDGNKECDLLIDAAAKILNNPALMECKYGCGLNIDKGMPTCLECQSGEVGSDSSDTDCGKGQFCDLGRCIYQKQYGALIGIFNAKTVCLSGIADGTLPTSKCVDCVRDSDCVTKAIDSCEKDPTVGRYNGTETSKRRLFCDSNSQCKSESIQSKRKDYVTCLNIGGCCDRYGHLWEKGCNAGDVRRYEAVTPKCTHNCCRKDNGVYVGGVECNKKTQIKRGEFKAKDDPYYKISQESCEYGCCNLDGSDAGYTGATYCPNYYRNQVLPTVEKCGYDCCKEGSIRDGAGFFILSTDCAQSQRNGACICDIGEGDAVYNGEYFAHESPIPSSWFDDNGQECGRNFREFPYWTYLYGNHECGSPDTFIDHYGTLKECADACRARVGCKYFIYGTSGSSAGNCYEEHTTGDNCPGYPWVSGNFDFYKLDESKKTYTRGGVQYGIHPTYGKHNKKGEHGEWSYDYSAKVLYFGYECGSDDTYLGSFSSVSGCENACKAKAGCEYFIYGYGSKSGKCYQEHMTADNCPGYSWIKKEYDIYKLTRNRCVGVAKGEFVMVNIFDASIYCAHNCCDRGGFSNMYNTWTCSEPIDNPNWRGRYMTTRNSWYITGWGECAWGCCKYYTGTDNGWKKPGCTDWQTVFETGRALANYHPSYYTYTLGQDVPLPCDHTCCFPDGVLEVQQRYCKHFTDAQLSDAGITTDLSMWKNASTRTTKGKQIQPRCTHHCCTDKGWFSSMELHGECPSSVHGVPVVKNGEDLDDKTCLVGCCATDGTTKDHYGHNKGCIAHQGERSYLPGHSYGGHTAVGDNFYQELDCDSVLQNEYNDCKDSTRCEFENTYGRYKPNCLHRTPLLLWSDKLLGGWGEFCNSISDENKWEAEKYADNVDQYSTTSTGLALQAMQYAQEAQNYATVSSATSVDTGEATIYANKASEAAAFAQIAKNNILQSATTARYAANIGDVSLAQSQQTNALYALNDVISFTSQAQQLSNDVRVISEINVERERVSQLGPFTKDWWFYINPNSEFDGNQRSFTYKNTYTHINDKSCSYYGSSSIASANECQRAAEQLGIIFSNYKVSSVSNSAEPTGCYLWSSSADGNNLSLYYNEVASSTTSCGWEERSQYQSNSGGCLCIDKYAKLSTGDTCDSAGLTSIGSAGECKKAAIQLGIASSNDVLKITSDTDASISSPSCFQRQDGQVEYNEVSKKHEPILRHGFCIKNVDSAAKCFAIADRMGLAGRPRRFESYPGWNCNNIGDTTDDGYKCCSGSNNGCNDGTCWWASSAGSEAGTCEQTVTTPNENSWDHAPSGCFIDENFTPHFNTKSTTVPCGGTYPCICDELIRSGTCESVGYNTIDTAAKCWKYAVERGWGHGTNYEGSWGHLAPGCTVDPYGNPHFNSYSSGNTCSDSYGCICDTLLRSGTCNNIIQSKHECFKSAIAKGFRSVRHTSGSWGHVPQGCSISSDGEALFNDASSSVVCSNTYGCICSTTTTKKCDVADCNGLICSNKYATVTLGTCASNGYSYIRSKYDCQLATNAQNKLYMKSPVQDEVDLDKPAYCYMDNDGMTHYNNLDWNQRPVCDGTFSIPFSWYTTSTFTSCSQFQNEIGPYAGENTGGWLVDACQTGFQGGDCSTIGLSFGKTACNWGKQAKKASTKGCCVAGSFSIPFDWWTTSTFTSCSQLQNEIGPYAGTNNGGWIVNTCQMGFQGVDCSNVAAGYGRTACQWGSNAKKASIQGCLCLLDSKCGATQVLNSDKSSSNSITGINGDTVYFICDLGYYIKNSDFMRGGSMTCGGDGNFKFDVGSDICVPMMRSNISSMIYGSLTPESKFRHISMANSKHFTNLRVSKNVKQAIQYSKMRISANELPTNISKDITNIYQSQKLEIYTPNNTLLTDSCEKGTDCCDISLDISMDTKIQLSIPNAILKKAGFCRNPIKSKEECASAVKSLNLSAYNYNIKPSLVYSYQDIPCDICSTYKFNITVNTIPNTSPHYGRLDPPGCFLYKDEANSDKIIPYFNPELNSKTDCSYSNRALENYAGGCICLEDSYEYVQIHSGYCDKPIITTNECILAVKTLQLSLKYPYSAESKQITEGSWPLKPYGCSISKVDTQTDDVVVYFNTYISSNSDCSYKSDNTDGCICKSKEDTIPVVSLPNREGSWSITCNKNKAIAKQTLTTLSSSSLSVISSNDKNKCVKRITDIDSCNIAANTLGIDGSVQIISKNNIAEGCYHTSYEPIATGQCEEIERIDTIEECQIAVGFLGYSESVTIDSNAPYGCSLWRQASTGAIFVYFNPDVNDIKDAGSSLVGTYYYQSICRNKKAYLNVHSSDIGCSESNKCICYGEYYSNTVKMECWDDYMRKWDTPFEKQDNYLKCNHHKITALTNTIIPMQCPSTEILNSDKSSVGSINGTIFSSVQVNCDDGFFGGGTSTCDYHIDKNDKVENKYDVYHRKSGICERDILNKHDCYEMVKSLDLTKIQMDKFYSGTESNVFIENSNKKCTNSITSPEECYEAIKVLALDMVDTTEKNIRTIHEQMDTTPAGCIFWKEPYTNKYIAYFNPKLTSEEPCNSNYTGCICKSETHFKMNTQQQMCQNIEQRNTTIRDIHYAQNNKWYSPFTSVDIIPDSLNASLYPHGCFLYKINNDNEQIRAYFNPHYSNIDCATNKSNYAGCVCQPIIYTNLSSGTCESNGHMTIHSTKNCQVALSLFNKGKFEDINPQVITESSDCICTKNNETDIFNNSYVPKPHGCTQTDNGDKFLNIFTSNTECSDVNECMCKMDTKNNVFYSSFGSCLTIGDGYAPLTTNTKCLEAAIDTGIVSIDSTTNVVEVFNPELPSNCIYSNQGNLILNSAPTTKLCSNSDTEGCFCEKKYFYIEYGTCDSHGYAPITSEELCKEASISLNRPWKSKLNKNESRFTIIENTNALPNCWEDNDGSLILNKKTSIRKCSKTSGCFCQRKRVATFDNMTCKSISYCTPTEVPNSNASNIGSIKGKDIIHVECDTGYSGGGTVTCNHDTGLFSTTSCRYCSKGYGYASVTNHTCVRCTDQGVGTNATYNDAPYSSSICAQQKCPFGMGIYNLNSSLLNIDVAQDCVKCPENTFSDSSEYGQCQNVQPGYVVKTNETLNNLLQVAPKRTEVLDISSWIYTDSVFSARRRRLARKRKNNRQLYFSEMLFIYEKVLFEVLSISNSLLCELNLMMAKAKKELGLIQKIEIEQVKCWLPQDTNMPENNGKYFVKADGTKDTLYDVQIPTSVKTPTTFTYNIDENTISFGTQQYGGTFAAISNPTSQLEYGEFVLKWNSTYFGTNNYIGGHLSALVSNDGHYILRNYVKNNDDGIIQEEFLYRNITGKWTKTRREQNDNIQTKNAMRSSSGRTIIETDFNGVKNTICYENIYSPVYDFQIDGVTTVINQMTLVDCGSETLSNIPSVNFIDMKDLDVEEIVYSRQIRIGQIQITCKVNSIDNSVPNVVLTAGQTTQVQCAQGYEVLSNDTILCQMNGTYNTDSVQCVKSNCTKSFVENSNVSNFGDIYGVTGDSHYVQCDPGYIGSGVTTCMTSGLFSTVVCSKRQCFNQNKNLLTPNFDAYYQDTVNVQCKAGYSSSVSSVTCQSNGVFTSVQCNQSACIINVTNSNAQGNILQHNSSMDIICDQGYEGGGLVHCNSDSTFTPDVHCTPKLCAPSNVPNSDKSQQGSIVGFTDKSVYVQCDQGYTGSAMSECMPSGIFSSVVCSPIQCSTTKTTSTDVAFDGQEYNICSGDDVSVTWNGYHNICEMDQNNFNSPPNSNSYCNGGTQLHAFESQNTVRTINNIGAAPGQTRYFICSLHPSAKFKVTCSANTLPEGVANTQLSGYYGQPTQLNCAYGYEGGGDVSCDVNGNFNIQNNICIRKKCIVSVPNSNTNNKILSYQENINVQCDSAYNGGGLFVCGVNGQYTGTTCTPKVCAPTQIYNSNKAEIGSIQGVYGQVVKIKCNPLYRPFSSEGIVSQNSIMITCLTSGVFQSGECQIMYNFDVPRDTVVKKNYILTIASEIRNMHIDKNERKSNMAKLSRQLYTSNKVEGLSKRQTVKQSKLEIVKDDLDDKMLKKIPKTSRKVYIIPAPPNSGSIDTCSNGVNDDDCCTYSFSDDTDLHNDDIPVHETGEEIGSWSILCKGDVIVSKQTRENNGLKMECWDEYNKLWGNAMPNMSAGDYYKCQSHTILVGSQTPLGTMCETNAVSSSNYSNVSSITAFVDETITVQCDANYIGGGSLTCGADGNFSNNNVECFPVYNGNIQYDCQNAKRIYQEGLCCSGSVSTILVHNDKLISCFDLREQYKPNCGCGSDTDMVVVSFQ